MPRKKKADRRRKENLKKRAREEFLCQDCALYELENGQLDVLICCGIKVTFLDQFGI